MFSDETPPIAHTYIKRIFQGNGSRSCEDGQAPTPAQQANPKSIGQVGGLETQAGVDTEVLRPPENSVFVCKNFQLTG